MEDKIEILPLVFSKETLEWINFQNKLKEELDKWVRDGLGLPSSLNGKIENTTTKDGSKNNNT